MSAAVLSAPDRPEADRVEADRARPHTGLFGFDVPASLARLEAAFDALFPVKQAALTDA